MDATARPRWGRWTARALAGPVARVPRPGPAQGEHDRPLPPDELAAWLADRDGRPGARPAAVRVPAPRDPGGPGERATRPAVVRTDEPEEPGAPAAPAAPSAPAPVLPTAGAVPGAVVLSLGRDAGARPSVLFAAAGVAVVLASRWLPDRPQLVLLSLVQVLGAVAVLVGVRRHRPVRSAAWLTLAAGGISFGAGVACWYVYAHVLHRAIPYPGWPDLFFVPAFLSYLAGLALMIGRRSPARQTQALLDALVLAVGLAFASWVFLTASAVGGAVTPAQTVITVVYPMIDVVMVGVVARLLLTGGITPALWLVAGGMVANLVGDTAYSVLAARGEYQTGALPDQMWMLCTVLVGAAALHPSMRSLVTQVEDPRVGSSRVRLLFLFLSLHVPVAVLVIGLLTGTDVPLTAVALAFAVVGPLTALRIQHLTAQLRTLSMSDKLTGLVSRELLVERLERTRRSARAGGGRSAVLFIDLDRFKAVNDTYGHAAGDDVLVLASKRLQRLAGAGDLVCRLGGDEFVLVVDEVRSADDSTALAQRVVDSMSEPFSVGGHEVHIGASVGITVPDGADPAAVLRRGDAAMYRAKAAGRSRWAHDGPDPAATAPLHARSGTRP